MISVPRVELWPEKLDNAKIRLLTLIHDVHDLVVCLSHSISKSFLQSFKLCVRISSLQIIV